ncbi:phospholipid methyltransferase-domain-containing protein [Spinellus fusiger]|nr:phospholipid methyltransferase-domain-containing protein [Spinellus fusiger]
MDSLIDIYKPSLYLSLASILFNPLFWNCAARTEYHKHTITKIAGGNPYYGCYALGVIIFGLGIIRDYMQVSVIVYVTALVHQPTHPILESGPAQSLAVVLFCIGNILVLSSMWRLGVTGTYLGDYFGILMSERVTRFPFNVCTNPMYTGSTFSFLATALWHASPTGILLTLFVHIVYMAALEYEGPFTVMIYSQQEKKE